MHMFRLSPKLACKDVTKTYALMLMSLASYTNNTVAINIASASLSNMTDKAENITSDITYSNKGMSSVKSVPSADVSSIKTSPSLLSQSITTEIPSSPSPHHSQIANNDAITDTDSSCPADLQLPFSEHLLRMVTGSVLRLVIMP